MFTWNSKNKPDVNLYLSKTFLDVTFNFTYLKLPAGLAFLIKTVCKFPKKWHSLAAMYGCLQTVAETDSQFLSEDLREADREAVLRFLEVTLSWPRLSKEMPMSIEDFYFSRHFCIILRV